MEQIGIHQAKTQLSRLLKRIALGEEIMITNRGKEVARIVPPRKKSRKQKNMITQLRELADRAPLGANFDELMAWKNEGRK